MIFPEEKKQELHKLIREGETLDIGDLQQFYRWVHNSYDALRFHPTRQLGFDQCCRSSIDSFSMRVYIGLWMLKLTLDEMS